MSIERSVEILKQALLLEKRGKSFYNRVAEQTSHNAVRDFFSMMAEEEQNHIDALLKQYKALKENGKFSAAPLADAEDPHAVAAEVINDEVAKLIDGADYESAAILAAISMEERAIKIYTQRSKSATDPEEVKLYEWLAAWERNHLQQLLEIDKAITERIWNDNNFWPF